MTWSLIIEHVWDIHFDSVSNVVEVHINSLRNKVDRGFDVPLIHTVRGVGYMLTDTPPEAAFAAHPAHRVLIHCDPRPPARRHGGAVHEPEGFSRASRSAPCVRDDETRSALDRVLSALCRCLRPSSLIDCMDLEVALLLRPRDHQIEFTRS